MSKWVHSIFRGVFGSGLNVLFCLYTFSFVFIGNFGKIMKIVN